MLLHVIYIGNGDGTVTTPPSSMNSFGDSSEALEPMHWPRHTVLQMVCI